MKYINTLPSVHEYFADNHFNDNNNVEFDDMLNGSAINKYNSIVYSKFSSITHNETKFVDDYLSQLFSEAYWIINGFYIKLKI